MEPFIVWLNTLPSGILLVSEVIIAFSVLYCMFFMFRETGIVVFIALASLLANIQVQKVVWLWPFKDPVALGTVVFSSLFLATDALNELYGERAARRGVMIGVLSILVSSLLMVITLGFKPITPDQTELAWAWDAHQHMMGLFMPLPRLFVAGVVAYLLSQLLDVWLYALLKRVTGGRWLWLRNNVSTLVAGFVDNLVFSVLAWVILAEEPLSWIVVWQTYVVATYGLRVVIALLDTPILYLIRAQKTPADAGGK